MIEITNPLSVALVVCGMLALACWGLSIATGNSSQVDRLWSIAPPLYVLLFAGYTGFADLRLNMMTLLSLTWGVRLTYNFARKGGYRRGSEDYRWPELRRMIGPVAFQLLNATFIAPAQNVLLLLLAAPAYVAYQNRGAPMNALDWTAAAAFVLFLAVETVADQQQWRFQCAKRAARERGEMYEREFVTTGLFRYSRHPNFFCEQAMWWVFYVFAVAASRSWLGWTIAGPALLTMLFQASTWLTERLTLAKYPAYRLYQESTSRLVPWFPAARERRDTARSSVHEP